MPDLLRGTIVKVHDGDTVTLKVGRKKYSVRLANIDAPELRQPRGRESGEYARGIADGRKATVRVTGKDRWRRVIGVVTVEGRDLNAEMVRSGWAWYWDKYGKDENLAKLMKEAKKAVRGLWADADPVPPWEWRKR